ncbi:enoyl-CoA hydratase/isomerase family protein [Halomarina halobia]|uniref:Enoyl-CoA hydratase/isomerase family protein n=1 Tax=Halomarina halobia TaxID=3033386 RepID=A0ABD6AET7_9EURY|nr:enoyl-CoA hydratase/isomerase family protein [Halomarina sp. PSR21]
MDITDPFLKIAGRPTDAGSFVDVRLARPDKQNALPGETVDALVDVFDAAAAGEADALVVSGDGENFCVGADLADLASEADEDPARIARRVQTLVDAVRSCPVPVVVSVHGRALGVGCHLCLGADVVVGATSATWGFPEVALDLPVTGYVVPLLTAQIGERRARDWLLTGRTVGAEEAEHAGFVTRVVPDDDRADAVEEYVDTFAANGKYTVSVLRERFAAGATTDLDSLRRSERRAFDRAFRDGTAGERIDAFRGGDQG